MLLQPQHHAPVAIDTGPSGFVDRISSTKLETSRDLPIPASPSTNTMHGVFADPACSAVVEHLKLLARPIRARLRP